MKSVAFSKNLNNQMLDILELPIVLTMHSGFVIDVEKDGPSSSFLERGFLKCIVSQTQEPFGMRSFVYCLHCFKPGSQSWFDFHKKVVRFDLSEKTITKHMDRFPRMLLISSPKSSC